VPCQFGGGTSFLTTATAPAQRKRARAVLLFGAIFGSPANSCVLHFFSRKDTKNNSLREHQSVASYIRPESKLSANA